MASNIISVFLFLNYFIFFIYAVPERGIKEMVLEKNAPSKSFAKSLFKDAEITISGKIMNDKDKNVGKKDYSLKWYLLRSDCAQYFMQISDEEAYTLIINDAKTLHPLHTLYSQGDLPIKDGLLPKTVIPWGSQVQQTDNSKDGKTTGDIKSKKTNQKTKKDDDKAKTMTKATLTKNKKKMTKKGLKEKAGSPHRAKRDAPVPTTKTDAKKTVRKTKPTTKPITKPTSHPTSVSGRRMDGNYLLVVISEELPDAVTLEVKVDIKMNTGYLSAAEWPLLPFYGAMSLVYLAYGVVWLIVSACQWRELLRIQFWIGGVIALGMLEKAILFSEYNNVNDTGVPAHGLVVLALILSCIKRTLSRILIIIVSMGFGIVKPRLGGALHRVLGVACLYFILSVIEGSYREFSVKADVSRKQAIASVPLSVLDAVICWWIFMSLLQTMRTLRIRKNLVKLSLYRHFTNILLVSVIASVVFMVWIIKVHQFNSCIKDWKEIWIDDAFWHFLFALILLAIMILWRPTANNQRYAFTPLIDVGEDDDDDMTLSDAFQGMKMRGKGEGEVPNKAEKLRKKAQDDLKWVEENIPTSGGIDTALPTLLDSDEEMMTTKLEMSKME